MKSRSAKSIFAVTIVFTILFGVSPAFSQDKASLLNERCNSFYENFALGRYGNMWDMATQAFQESATRDGYTAYMKKILDHYFSRFFIYGYDQCAKLAEGRNNVAFSKVFITLENNRGEEFQFCDLIVFLWSDDNWYFSDALSCEYENDNPEIFKNF